MSINIQEVVAKLIGPIEPGGETYKDLHRLTNMREMVNLAAGLVDELALVVAQHRGAHQHSIREIVKVAMSGLEAIRDTVTEDGLLAPVPAPELETP